MLGRRRTVGWAEMRLLRIDYVAGMLLSEIATWSIIVVTGTVLHGHGVTDIRTAADAARALEPLVQTFPHAGFLAKAIFATGVIGLGLLGVPVLAGSSAYAFAEAMQWNEGLAQTPRQARGFYGVIAAGTAVGLLMNFVGVDPIKALIYAAVLNGLVAVPLIFLIARIAGSDAMMGTNRSGRLSISVVWATFGAMGAAAVALVVTLVNG